MSLLQQFLPPAISEYFRTTETQNVSEIAMYIDELYKFYPDEIQLDTTKVRLHATMILNRYWNEPLNDRGDTPCPPLWTIVEDCVTIAPCSAKELQSIVSLVRLVLNETSILMQTIYAYLRKCQSSRRLVRTCCYYTGKRGRPTSAWSLHSEYVVKNLVDFASVPGYNRVPAYI